MKPATAWNDSPFCTPDEPSRAFAPYICRIVPGMTTVDFDFTDRGAGAKDTHTLYWRISGRESFEKIGLDTEQHGQLYGLRPRTEVEFYLVRDADGTESLRRTARTAMVPGRIVDYLHPADPAYAFSGQYLSSPCLCRLSSGLLLASADVRADDAGGALTLLFSSEDDGQTWQYRTELFPCCRGQLFEADGRLYLLAQSGEGGDLLIGASDNEGRSWQPPTVLFRSARRGTEIRGLFREPQPLTEANGRLWTDLCFVPADGVPCHAVLSAPADGTDLTDPAAWILSGFLPGTEGDRPACGCLVSAPDGTLTDLFVSRDQTLTCLRIRADMPEAEPEFLHAFPIPVRYAKAGIFADGETGEYRMLACRACETPRTERNLLSLFRSADLARWEPAADILDAKALPTDAVGFQSVSPCIDGDDLLFLSSTAYAGAAGFRDANYVTFHRIAGFRSL